MIGLEYIVKLYSGTYKKLAELLGITPSTVTDWLSKRRPIQNPKLEALSKLFHLEPEYFQKELTKIEEIELRLEYLDRISQRESFEILDYFTDEEGNEQQYTRSIDPYQEEKRAMVAELGVERLILKLQGALYQELYTTHGEDNVHEILDRISNLFNESGSDHLDSEQQIHWENKHVSVLRPCVQ